MATHALSLKPKEIKPDVSAIYPAKGFQFVESQNGPQDLRYIVQCGF